MVNNFIQLRTIMSFDNTEEFYYVQIKRGDSLIKSYAIESIRQLMDCSSEIIKICRMIGAKAYMFVSKRDFKAVSLRTAFKILEERDASLYSVSRVAFDIICQKYYIVDDRKWIVDMNEKTIHLNPVLQFIEQACEPKDSKKVIATVNTGIGYHIITKPFEIGTFTDTFPTISIKRNDPTILFIP